MTNDFHYRWNPQTYAGQGFAVVTVNFHGSTGYGQEFTDAISERLGRRAARGPARLGWAAALRKVSRSSTASAPARSARRTAATWRTGSPATGTMPWKCIVAHDGVFDSRMMCYSTEELWFDEWEHGGKPQYDDPDGYEKFNPVDHVKEWRVPMLVVHGDLDYRIPLEQGIAAFTALQRRGIPSKFLLLPGREPLGAEAAEQRALA